MTDLLRVFLMSMTPVGELRLSIPMGMAVYHLSAVWVFFVSVVGNIIPAVLLLFFLKRASVYLSKKSLFFQKAFSWWENNAREKHSEKVKKYGAIGLALFVAVPLPLTGAWTGALLATIMNLPLKKSLPTIIIGVVGAGIIVTALVGLGISIEKYLGWQTLIGALVFLSFVYIYLKKQKFL